METERLREILAIIDRTVLVRRITLGTFCVLAIAVLISSGISPLNPLFSVPFLWLLLTVPFEHLVHRQRSLRAVQNVHAAFLVIEVLFVGYLVHRLGGVEWIGVMFNIFTVMYANFFLPRAAGYLVTGLAAGSFVLVAFLEYAGLIPHFRVFAHQGPPYRDLPYVLATVLVGGVGVYGILAFTVRAFADLFERKNRELERRRDALERLSLELLSAREEERRRIARRIHDEMGQTLAAARWALAAGKAKEADGLLAELAEGLRKLARELRPPLLDELGLRAALSQLLDDFAGSTGIEVERKLPEGRFPPEVEIAVYRVVQEALENVRRHARAGRVAVEFELLPQGLRGRIADDGVGFDRRRVHEGLGLSGMREWISLVGGELSISSSPGRGTVVEFEIPLPSRSPITDHPSP
ncbi:sensor histidine kinase [Candidatus Bipolaricaulota sp. J31]